MLGIGPTGKEAEGAPARLADAACAPVLNAAGRQIGRWCPISYAGTTSCTPLTFDR